MTLFPLLVWMFVGLASSQLPPQIFDPRIPKDCPVRNSRPEESQAIGMMETLGGFQVGWEAVPMNGQVPGGSGKVKGRQCVMLDMINCGFVTAENYAKKDGTYGTGPYKAWYSTDPSLPKHTIYLPKKIPADIKIPAIVFTDSGIANGTYYIAMLVEWASHGFMVIATGATEGHAHVQRPLIKEAIDFIIKNAGTGNYTQVEPRIGVAGHRAGCPLAHDFAQDSRVMSLALLNGGAGGFDGRRSTVEPSKSEKPTAFFLGGGWDGQSMFAERDFEDIPSGTPKWKGNLNTGEFGTYCQPYGGQFGTASSNWWKWTLRGDQRAGKYFTGSGAWDDGWQTFGEDLDVFKIPTPLPGNENRA